MEINTREQNKPVGLLRRATRSWHPALRLSASLGLMLVLTGCLLRSLSGLVIVDDLGKFIDLIFADVSAAYCRNFEDFATGATVVECKYNIVTGDGTSERTSTAELLSEFGVFGIIVDPVIMQVPEIATIVRATVDDGSGPQDLVITETTAFDVTPDTQATAQAGHKFWIIDLPPAIEAVLPTGPTSTPPEFDYNFSYRLPGDFSTDPVAIKAMYAGRVEVGGRVFYIPMLPCTTDFADVPEILLPVNSSLGGQIFALLFLFLDGADKVCNNQVYDFSNLARPPEVELRKQVSLDGVNFFDADLPGDPDVPVGVVGETDATYRLIVNNPGPEVLINVFIEDPQLGIATAIADLLPNETRVLEAGDARFGNLFQPRRCGGNIGIRSNAASILATGETSGEEARNEDSAHVRCIRGPEIRLRKQVRLDGPNFVEADTPADGPTGVPGADATYRLIVSNEGDEALTDITINDNTLGIIDETLPDLPMGSEVVINAGFFGRFSELFVPGRCDTPGPLLNTAEISARGASTGGSTFDDNPAWVNCETPSTLPCDINADGMVDLTDVRAILGARGQRVPPGDPRDVDGDGVISVLDARQCVLQCTNPRCR